MLPIENFATKDEDDMASNSATHVPTQQSVKAYVDSVASGLDVKKSCRVATTANLTSLSGTQTIDNITLTNGDRILVKDQTSEELNGIYNYNSSGDWSRSNDFDSNTEVTSGAFTFIEEGDTNADSGFVLTTDGSITVGTTSLTFSQFSGAGQITAGTGLDKSGNTINLSINEYSDVTPVNGDKLLTLDSDGSTHQLTTLSSLATLFAGSNLTATDSIINIDDVT